MSSLALRTLAVLTMLVDHLGYACDGRLPGAVCLAMRLVGRLSMPIFCFLIAEGFYHTRDVRRYAGRLLLFAIVAEIPYDWFCSQGESLFRWSGQNVFFTLLLGLLALCLCDRFALLGRYGLALAGALSCAVLAQLANADYGMFGVLFIFIFYCFRKAPRIRAFSFAGACVLLGLTRIADPVWAVTLTCAATALLPIWLYNGEKGRGGRKLQMAFYAFYPLHMILITLLVYGLGQSG